MSVGGGGILDSVARRKRSASPDGGGLVSPSNGLESPEQSGRRGGRGAPFAGGGSQQQQQQVPPAPTLKLGGTSSSTTASAGGQQREPSRQPQHQARPGQHEGPVKRPFKVRRKEDDVASYGRPLEGCSMVGEYLVEGDLGVGTFGVVTKATRRDAGGTKVAMKRIIVHNETDGVPITTIREIKLLKSLSHENIVPLYDMVFQEGTAQTRRGTILMVFPYMDHDLSGLLDNERVVWTAPMIKLYAKQLLKGTAYLHKNNLIHRDLKSANILVDNTGVLKIADFGLARSILGGLSRANNEPGSPEYTNMVVTRWYRPPELFLRFRKYGTSIDIWGVGCILGEMLTKRPILQGNTDQEQLQKIWELCGLPTKDNFPEWDEHGGCPDDGCEHPEKSRGQLMVPPLHIQSHLQWRRHVRDDFLKLGSASYADLIDRCLTLDPAKRPTALECLEHEYFQTLPAPAKLGSLQIYGASHEAGRKNNRTGPAPRLLYQGQPIPPIYADWPRAATYDPSRQAGDPAFDGGSTGAAGGVAAGSASQLPPPASFNPHLPVPTLHAQAPQPVPNGSQQPSAAMMMAGGFMQQQQQQQQQGMPPIGYGMPSQQQQPFPSGQQQMFPPPMGHTMQQQQQQMGFPPPPGGGGGGFRPPLPVGQVGALSYDSPGGGGGPSTYGSRPPPTMLRPSGSSGTGSGGGGRRDRAPVHRATSTASGSGGPTGLMLAPTKRPPPSFIPGLVGDDHGHSVGFRPPPPPPPMPFGAGSSSSSSQGHAHLPPGGGLPGYRSRPPPPPSLGPPGGAGFMGASRPPPGRLPPRT